MTMFLAGYLALWMARGCLALSDAIGVVLRGRPAWLETLSARLLLLALTVGKQFDSSICGLMGRDPMRHETALLRLLPHNGRPRSQASAAWWLLCMHFHTPRTQQALQAYVSALADQADRLICEKLLDARPLGAPPFDMDGPPGW